MFVQSSLERLAERFQQFAELECPGMSPLYQRLSQGLARGPELLAPITSGRPNAARASRRPTCSSVPSTAFC